MIAVFLSRPIWVKRHVANHLSSLDAKLQEMGFHVQTVGTNVPSALVEAIHANIRIGHPSRSWLRNPESEGQGGVPFKFTWREPLGVGTLHGFRSIPTLASLDIAPPSGHMIQRPDRFQGLARLSPRRLGRLAAQRCSGPQIILLNPRTFQMYLLRGR